MMEYSSANLQLPSEPNCCSSTTQQQNKAQDEIKEVRTAAHRLSAVTVNFKTPKG